ncbi:MAG: hypothetical protein JWL81_982 [Verrucomicrobiales bacterium]|nr:hypothetical protein [Verrucomicrobiales bacterium]
MIAMPGPFRIGRRWRRMPGNVSGVISTVFPKPDLLSFLCVSYPILFHPSIFYPVFSLPI